MIWDFIILAFHRHMKIQIRFFFIVSIFLIDGQYCTLTLTAATTSETHGSRETLANCFQYKNHH